MPRFKLEYGIKDLKKQLESMGLESAFMKGNMGFQRMCTSSDLYISSVLHKAVVDVNEKGTEAAAAGRGTSASAAPAMRPYTSKPLQQRWFGPPRLRMRNLETNLTTSTTQEAAAGGPAAVGFPNYMAGILLLDRHGFSVLFLNFFQLFAVLVFSSALIFFFSLIKFKI